MNQCLTQLRVVRVLPSVRVVHLFCKSCLQKSEQKTCPNCRVRHTQRDRSSSKPVCSDHVSPVAGPPLHASSWLIFSQEKFGKSNLRSTNAFAVSIVCGLRVRCAHHDAGCDAIIEIGTSNRGLVKHVAECKFMPRPCRRCAQSVTTATQDKHDQEGCAYHQGTGEVEETSLAVSRWSDAHHPSSPPSLFLIRHGQMQILRRLRPARRVIDSSDETTIARRVGAM